MDQNAARLLLVLLPPGERRLEFAEPMGTPAQLQTRLAELLPGTTFDENRHGTFHRGGYEITFDFIAERTATAQATGVEVSVGRGEGFTALKRIVEKTGWQAVDTSTLRPIDLDRSRVAGTIVIQSSDAPAQTTQTKKTAARSSPPPRAVVIGAGGAVLVLACAALAWQWSRGAGRTSHLLASELAAGPPAYMHLPSLSARDGAEARKAAAAQFVLAAEEIRARLERLKDLAPEFRDDEIVHQLVQFREASATFPAKVGENGFMKPERLSDAAFFTELHAAPILPSWFAQPQRDDYVFEFTGDDCTWRPHMVELGTLCFGFAYSARPLEASGGKRSYTLFSADQRIHYRNGGAAATQTDPVVEIGGDMSDAGGPPQPALEEAYALRDLRHAASAERMVSAMIGRGYVNPERLAEQTTYLGAKVPSMVPGYFVQSVRQGYKFEFAGGNAMRAPTPFGQAYESFVYSALPQGKSSGRRRAFALYSDGKIYANADGHLPTSSDTPVDGR